VLTSETQVMRQEEPRRGDSIGSLDWLEITQFEPAAASDQRGWVGLEAVHYCETPAFELDPPSINHHNLVPFTQPPEELDLRYEGVKRHVPPLAGSILLVPADSQTRVRSSGCKDELHIFPEPGLVARVAALAFDLDSARLTVPPLDHFKRPVGVTPGQFQTPARIA
jgi:hypothetical protein